MNQLTNYKYKIDFLISNDTYLSQQTETILKPKVKRKIYEKCNECNKRRRPLDESHQICRICYNMKITFKPSGNKIVDDFIRYTQINLVKKEGKLKFVPYDEFKDIEFIAEGGFSKIYKATWIDGLIGFYRKNTISNLSFTVVLKKLNNSKNITSKELNELKIFYNYYTKWRLKSEKVSHYLTKNNYISNYFGITQDLITQDFMIIMPYYSKGDLIRYISNNFYNINWASRRPFWDRNHDTYLIIDISDGLRPPIVTYAPEGFIELMIECWDSNPDKRPTADDIYSRICEMYRKEGLNSPTKIIESSDIGPVQKNNPGAIYKSRPLSAMINSAMSLRSLRSQSINLEKVKRKFEDNNDDGQSIKRKKLFENENNDYFTKEIELDIDINSLNNNGK
ncbi:hypothetical protein RhiirB3_438608 [Rhizophagus irregularis]|nr:hypothetical protein RhiirB3_438608 [Rhizophagus irregularis]